MGDIFPQYEEATKQVLASIPTNDPELAQCRDYGTSSFLGTSNACVCSRMGKTEAAIAMRDGLHDEYMKSGSDTLSSHLKYIRETWHRQGGGMQLVDRILKNGLECPGTMNNEAIIAPMLFNYGPL